MTPPLSTSHAPTSKRPSAWGTWALLTALLVLSVCTSAWAEGSSTSQLRTKIQAAFQQHYLATEFDAAEAELLALIQGCDASCAREDLAAGWMYIGIVRAGKQAADEAQAAFEQALALDPKVKLDISVASPETAALFVAAGGKVQGIELPAPNAAPSVETPRTESELRAEAARAGLVCGPQLGSLQTRRSLPVWCEANPKFWRVTLRYYAFNADDWVSIRMNAVDKRFEALIPCSATEFAGPLKYFVTVTNSEGGLLATLGNLKEPLVVQVAENVEEPAPAFPAKLPPERCAVQETCPPDFPGCEDTTSETRGTLKWGQTCAESRECKAGLYCEPEGHFCEASPQCDIDDDCPRGASCENRLCQFHGQPQRAQAKHPSVFGLHFAMDLGPVAGSNVCSTQNAEFECTTTSGGRAYPPALADDIALEPGEPGDPYPGASVGGFARGSMRLLLSYDRGVLPKVTVGGRLGVAFNGGPTGVDQPAFLPLHLEARASYWFFGTAPERVQPFVALGGGLAQVDLQKKLVVQDCSTQPSRSQFEDCINAEGDFEAPPESLPEVEVTATRRLGRGFVSANAGVYVPVFRKLGVVPALAGVLMFPEVGFVLQPSVGITMAF